MVKKRSRILGVVHATAKGLHAAGAIDKVTLRDVGALCGETSSRKAMPMAKSVFHDLYDPAQVALMEMRSTLMIGLARWLAQSDMTQAAAAAALGVTKARVSDIKRGAISGFSLDLLVRLAVRAGLRPKLKLVN